MKKMLITIITGKCRSYCFFGRLTADISVVRQFGSTPFSIEDFLTFMSAFPDIAFQRKQVLISLMVTSSHCNTDLTVKELSSPHHDLYASNIFQGF